VQPESHKLCVCCVHFNVSQVRYRVPVYLPLLFSRLKIKRHDSRWLVRQRVYTARENILLISFLGPSVAFVSSFRRGFIDLQLLEFVESF
jgi:hypothetical protein